MSSVRFKRQANVGIITIDNPPINLADNALFSAFENVLDEVDASDVRALLVQAAGDHFGCGVNVKTTFVDVDSKGARQMLGQGIQICTRLEGLNIPVVARVRRYPPRHAQPRPEPRGAALRSPLSAPCSRHR